MSYQNQDHWTFDDAIAQADWLTSQSGYDDLNDLWLSDPDLYTALAREWREDNPLNNLGG
jgi:hypothetical protein